MIIFARLFMENGQREVGCKMNDKGNSLLSEICIETDLGVNWREAAFTLTKESVVLVIVIIGMLSSSTDAWGLERCLVVS